MRQLGKTGLQIHEVGLGGIPIQRVNPETAKAIIDEMIVHHMNFIDTARGYTTSEALLGQALFGRRDQFIIATKSMAKTYEAMQEDILVSLSQLQTTWIDLYQIHNPKKTDDLAGPIKALLEAKDAGLIHHIGITNHSKDLLLDVIKWDVFETIQFPYNFLESQGDDLFRIAHQQGLGTIVMKPLAGGVIDNGPLAIKYILNNPSISVVIPGMSSIAQVADNAGAKSGEYTSRELQTIDELRQKTDHSFCHRCGYCLPCTQGIDIPLLFTFEGYYERYDLKAWATNRYQSVPIKADACIGCGVCEARCPYHLHIIERMKRIDELFSNQ
ncbi:MAG: aldo/keto reductase [Bacilli bacterium]